jgi:flap endonuclease-1
MGIKNLRIILNQKCQSAINIRKLDSYRGMTLGIDLSIFLYKYLYNNDDHIEGLTRLILRLLKNQITPIFIFDGKPPKEKDEVLQNRRDKKDFMNAKKNLIENCINFDKSNFNNFKENIHDFVNNSNTSYTMNECDIKELYEKNENELLKECEKLTKKIIYVTQYHIESSKNLFDLFGIKYIHAPCEAESLLAMLCKNNIVDGCISEDTDILPNGGHLFLKNFNAEKNTIEEYCLHGILDNLKFTNDKFIDLCILCGCDYTTKINGLGPITAYKLLCKYDNIENIIENNVKFIIPENFNYVGARLLFKNPLSYDIYNSIDKNTKMNKPNIEDLKLFLKQTSLKDKFLNEIDKNLINYYLNIVGVNLLDNIKESNNKKITDFFTSKSNK